MRQILDKAGISSGGAYNYFAGKDDIVKALVEAERADIDLLLTHLTGRDDPVPQIADLVYDSIACYTRDDAVLAAEIYAESCRNPAINAVIRANSDRISRRLHEAIQRGKQTGEITSRHSARELTGWLLALVDGHIGQIATDPDLDAINAARIAKHSVIDWLGSAR